MLDKRVIEEILSVALEYGADFAEVFIEDKLTDTSSMTCGILDKLNSGHDFGIGIRIFNKLDSVYAYTNVMDRENILKVTKNAAKSLKGNNKVKVMDFTCLNYENRIPVKEFLNDSNKRDVIEVMRKANEIALNYDEKIKQVIVRSVYRDQKVIIANSEGTFGNDRRVLSQLVISSIAMDANEKSSGYYGPAKAQGIEHFKNIDLDFYANESSRIALNMLTAKNAPSGVFPVVIDNEFGGVIFHEACGHSLEATSVAKNNSEFSGKLGQMIASEVVSATDDGSLIGEFGSTNIDDEGTKTRRNELIKDGKLVGYLVDKLNSRIMMMEPYGCARRESYRFAPTSRMNNTYIEKGKSTREEIISNTELGILARYMGGGSVNPITGEFNFGVNEGFMIRNCKIAEPIKGATLIGKGSEVLKKIDMVGNNLGFGPGYCGSLSGSVPNNVGQPTIRVKEITVGGRD